MSEVIKPQFTGDALQAAEHLRATTGKVGKVVTWMAAGSRSPSYLQLNWQMVSADYVPRRRWEYSVGNPRAGMFPRLWKTAYLLTMNKLELELLHGTIPDAVPAVAIKVGQVVQLGTHPRLQFGDYYTDDAAIAGREGRGDVLVTAGLWTPQPHRLLVPETLEMTERHVILPRFEEPLLRNTQIV